MKKSVEKHIKTYEGTLHVKTDKNLYGKKTPLTIDCESKKLQQEIFRIKESFYGDGAFKVTIDLVERK